MKNAPGLDRACDAIVKLFLEPPSARASADYIVMAEKMHLAALGGMLSNTVHCQESLDAAYEMTDLHAGRFRDGVHEMLSCMATVADLKAKGESSLNEQTRDSILKEMK